MSLCERSSWRRVLAISAALSFLGAGLSGCVVGAVVGAGTTVAAETVKTGAKVTGGAVRATSGGVFGDDDDDKDDSEKKKD